MHKMFYTNRIFSQLHAKREKDLKSAEMTTNKCLYGKVVETNLVQRNSEIRNAQKYRILKCVKCQWEEMIHIKLSW